MAKKIKSYQVISIGEKTCPKCNSYCERRIHRIITEKQLRQPYYYSQWDKCPNCDFVQHYEKFKIFNSVETRENAILKTILKNGEDQIKLL